MRLPPYLFVVAVVVGSPALSRTADAVPSFDTEVMPLLTKAGCNQGACHGKGPGQNGFRLSLRGFAPDQDYKWITREFAGRRLDRTKPEESLLLRKATGQTPHEGGRLFSTASREYKLLLDWLTAGYPGPDKAAAKVTKLELTPAATGAEAGRGGPTRRHRHVHRRHHARRHLAHQVRLERPRVPRSDAGGQGEGGPQRRERRARDVPDGSRGRGVHHAVRPTG